VLRVADAHRAEAFAVETRLENLPPVAAPPELLEAVLETLVENSRQAGAARVAIEGRAEGRKVRLLVCDDGPGIPPADHERIFEPFHTGRRSEGGSGLGLSIARSLLASCGGTIESKPAEKGAEFEICLPVA
jgi:two-component system, OmpR family, sensor histidine kinase ChvG